MTQIYISKYTKPKNERRRVMLWVYYSQHFLILAHNKYARAGAYHKRRLRKKMMREIAKLKVMTERFIDILGEPVPGSFEDVKEEDVSETIKKQLKVKKHRNCSFCGLNIHGKGEKKFYHCLNGGIKNRPQTIDPDEITDCRYWDGKGVELL